MTREFKLPDLGEGIHEGEVPAVKVAAGDAVAEGDIILAVETDKAAVDIPSPFIATVEIVHVAPGEVVAVGQVMITFSGDKAPAADKPTSAAPPVGKTIAAAPIAPPVHRKGPVPASPATRRLARELGVDLSQVTTTGTAGLAPRSCRPRAQLTYPQPNCRISADGALPSDCRCAVSGAPPLAGLAWPGSRSPTSPASTPLTLPCSRPFAISTKPR